jgi:hypothetical protein
LIVRVREKWLYLEREEEMEEDQIHSEDNFLKQIHSHHSSASLQSKGEVIDKECQK